MCPSPTEQSRHRSDGRHQSARCTAAHELQRGPLFERLLDRQLDQVADSLDRVAITGGTGRRGCRPDLAAVATTRAGPSEYVVDDEGSYAPLPQSVERRLFTPSGQIG